MDVNMQKMDGVTAARLIKVQYPEVAILGLSAKAKHYDIYAMQKAGASEVLSRTIGSGNFMLRSKEQWRPSNRCSSWKKRLT
jgi:DNA-binding NarL/FixJ family response regulator